MTDTAALFTTSKDGLKLHARRYGPAITPRLPVVCLPGISRTVADFDDIAEVLTAKGDRTVYAFDYRGRGQSDSDPNWQNYDVKVEIADVLDQLTALGIGEAVFFGTSRGGILTMLVGMLRPAAIRGAILNDIGPVIDGRGLARIKGYVGKLPHPRTFEDGASILKRISDSQFPAMSDEAWLRFARRTWREGKSGLELTYDPNLMKPLEQVDLGAPLPELWPQFEALAHVPVLVLRGEHSDILAHDTAVEMTRRHPNCRLVEVKDEGHAPFLADAPTQQDILNFVEGIDGRA